MLYKRASGEGLWSREGREGGLDRDVQGGKKCKQQCSPEGREGQECSECPVVGRGMQKDAVTGG